MQNENLNSLRYTSLFYPQNRQNVLGRVLCATKVCETKRTTHGYACSLADNLATTTPICDTHYRRQKVLHTNHAKTVARYCNNVNPSSGKSIKNNNDLLLNKFSSFLMGSGKKERGYTFLVKSLASVGKLSDSPLKKLSSHRLTDANEACNQQRLLACTPSVQRRAKKRGLVPTVLFDTSLNSTKVGTGDPRGKDGSQAKLAEVGKINKQCVRPGVHLVNSSGKSKGEDLFKCAMCAKTNLEQKQSRVKKNAIFCREALNSVKPIVETRKLRKGRATYQLPFITQNRRQLGVALRFLISSARKKKHSYPNGFVESFAHILKNSHQRSGESVEKRNNLYKLATDNRAYANLRWW